ncbi:MAG: PRC-barrel domain-containing protein [Candidatus Thorarchaeota archaeon]
MVRCYDLKYTGLTKKQVIDAKGEALGNVIDFIISVDGTNLTPKSMIIGGGRVEEILETIKVKPDLDPVFDIEQIDVVEEDAVRLKVDGETLCDKHYETSIEAGDVKLSDLSKAKVFDTDGFKVGNVIDIWFDDEGEMWLVLGGGFFEETMEKLRIIPDIDLLVTSKDLDSVSMNEIKLKMSKFQLESNCQAEYDRYKRELTGKEKKDDPRYQHLKLGSVPGRGFA